MTTDAYDHGAFCWTDLATTDSLAAKAFYGALFGWSSEDFDMGPDGVYTIARLNGGDVAGLHAMPEQLASQGVPPHWTTYLAVTSCDETAARARELGGTVVCEPFDIPDTGRMTMLSDPQGAALGLWQCDNAHPGYARLGFAHGTVCWNELATSDAAAARAFYTQLVGWDARGNAMPDVAYTEFVNGETSAAGMLQIAEDWGPVPPHWLVYFAVDDCDATVRRAREHGGAVLRDAFEVPCVGRMSVLADPQGAAFAIIQLAPMA